MLKTRVPAVLFVVFAVILTSISSAQNNQTSKSPNDLIGSWIVKVDGTDKNRSMLVTNISKSPEGSFVLEAKFGWPGSENPVVSAEVQQTEKGFTLSLASKSGAKVFAEQARDGSFVGNFVNASGSAVPARITKTAENSASLKPIAIEVTQVEKKDANPSEHLPTPCAAPGELCGEKPNTKIGDSARIPWLRESTEKVYSDKYLSAVTHKAFAIAKTGQSAWVSKRDSAERAAQHALYFCLKSSSKRCFLYAVDDKMTFDSYQSLDADTSEALSRLKAPAQKVYAREDRDEGVAPLAELKTGKLHEPTPTTAPFAKTVTTSGLVDMMTSATKPVVLDVLHYNGVYRRKGIPSAHWVVGAGIFEESRNGELDELFSRLMADIAPDKQTPIVAYCLNWECWLSYNALLRLSRQGYKELYWYRGGIESWQSAGLPTVMAPITAMVLPP